MACADTLVSIVVLGLIGLDKIWKIQCDHHHIPMILRITIRNFVF